MAVGSSNFIGLSLAAMMVTALAILISHAAPAQREASELFDVRSAHQLLLGQQDGLGPHPLATAENALVRERLVQALRAAGYDVELQSTYACSKQTVCGPAPVNLIGARGSVGGAAVDNGWRRISIVLEPTPLQTFVRLSLPPGARCENFTINDGQLSAPVQVGRVQGAPITLYGRYDARIGLEIACRTGAGGQYAVVEEVASQPGFRQAAWWTEFEQAYRGQNRGTRSTLRSSVPL